MQTIDNVIYNENVIIFIIQYYIYEFWVMTKNICIFKKMIVLWASGFLLNHHQTIRVIFMSLSIELVSRHFSSDAYLTGFFCNVQYKPLHAHMWNPVSLIHLPDYPKISNIPEDQMSWKINLLINRQE